MKTFIRLFDEESQALQGLLQIGESTPEFGAITIIETFEGFGLFLETDNVGAAEERKDLPGRGGRSEPIEVDLSIIVYKRLLDRAFESNILPLLALLGENPFYDKPFPVVLTPNKLACPKDKLPKAKGDIWSKNMDTLIPGKDVVVTAVDNNDADMTTPAPKTVTADADGLAYVDMLIPSGYSGSYISFRIDHVLFAKDELEAGVPLAEIKHTEIHKIIVI